MLDSSVFARHRKQLFAKMGDNSVALLGSPLEALRNGDAHFIYRQSSDLYYLTGFSEPKAAAILHTKSEESFQLFVRAKDPEREIWEGRRAGIVGAEANFAADTAFVYSALKKQLVNLLAGCDTFYYSFGVHKHVDTLVIAALVELRRTERNGTSGPKKIVDLHDLLHEMRLHKGPEELALMRKAAAITGQAHLACMREASPRGSEGQLSALLDYRFRSEGGNGPGYTSIVGCGANATILHYIENSAGLEEGQLVLIDAGCEYQNYTADVTRCFPVNGTFSETQRQCYALVLEAETQAISLIRPGVTLDEIHQRCVEVMAAGMVSLGLISGTAEECIASESYKQFFMHKSSHWLGLDVHDAGAYTVNGKPRPLAAGMVITVEPGLYIGDNAKVSEKFRGIGIRIEDDILVTERGYENLTESIPKTIAEVEAACKG